MGYKMNGWSGYQSSPAKQKVDTDTPVNPRNIKAEELVGDIGDQIDFLTEDYETHGTISKADYEAQMKVLRAKEKAAIDANKPK